MMTHLSPINHKARRIAGRERAKRHTGDPRPAGDAEVVALQDDNPLAAHIPLGCTLLFSPGWEADRNGGTAGLCQPVERDLFDCHVSCYWPAQVPDGLNHATDWTATCATAQKDWRRIDLIFP